MKLVKFTAVLTFIPLLVLMIMPVNFYTMLLGNEFEEVRTIVRYLGLGTLSLSASMILSHYFSGIGRIGKNTQASGIGVIATVLFGFALIPSFGLIGGAIVSSISYTSSIVFLSILFKKYHEIRFRDLLITKNDIKESWKLVLGKLTA